MLKVLLVLEHKVLLVLRVLTDLMVVKVFRVSLVLEHKVPLVLRVLTDLMVHKVLQVLELKVLLVLKE